MLHRSTGSDAVSHIPCANMSGQFDDPVQTAKRGPPPRFRKLSGLGLMRDGLCRSRSTTSAAEMISQNPVGPSYSVSSPFSRQPITKRVDKSRTYRTALTAHSMLRHGKRYLRPRLGTSSKAVVGMRHPAQLDDYITRVRQKSLLQVQIYRRFRTFCDLFDGSSSEQSDILTRKRLERKFTVLIRPLRQGTARLSWRDIKAKIAKYPQKDCTWFPCAVASLLQLWLQRQYVDKERLSVPEYWFEEASYKKRCCKAAA